MDFFTREEEARIVEAIRQAEIETTGEIRVYVEDFCLMDDPLERAFEVFTAHAMDKTQFQNAVLIYLAQRSRQFAILGDKNVHEKSGKAIFWKKEKTRFAQSLRKGNYCQGVLQVVKDVGIVLKEHFPAPEGWVNENELPDEIIYG